MRVYLYMSIYLWRRPVYVEILKSQLATKLSVENV